jgi:hypothetical protein
MTVIGLLPVTGDAQSLEVTGLVVSLDAIAMMDV